MGLKEVCCIFKEVSNGISVTKKYFEMKWISKVSSAFLKRREMNSGNQKVFLK